MLLPDETLYLDLYAATSTSSSAGLCWSMALEGQVLKPRGLCLYVKKQLNIEPAKPLEL